MAIKNQYLNTAYGLSEPTIPIFPQPIISKRNPTVNDTAPLGTEWINTATNALYFLTSIVAGQGNWLLVESSGGTGIFTTLTVTGTSTLDGLVTMNGGATITGTVGITGATTITGAFTSEGGLVEIGNDATDFTISIGTGALAGRTVLIGNNTGTSTTEIEGNIVLNPDLGSILVVPQVTSSALATATLDARVGQITFTGFTTAAAATQTFTITNTLAGVASYILVTISNDGTNAAWMTLTAVKTTASTITIVTTNNAAAAALNGNVYVNFWVLN